MGQIQRREYTFRLLCYPTPSLLVIILTLPPPPPPPFFLLPVATPHWFVIMRSSFCVQATRHGARRGCFVTRSSPAPPRQYGDGAGVVPACDVSV